MALLNPLPNPFKRVKPQCKGQSTNLWRLRPLDGTLGESVEKPIKAAAEAEHKPARERGCRVCPPHLRVPLDIDEEVLAYLQCEYAFRPRVPELMPQMANKARQFLSKYDITELSWARRRDIVIKSVGAAMDITQAEFDVRQHLRDPTQCDERKKQGALAKEGKITNGSLLWPGKHLPSAGK